MAQSNVPKSDSSTDEYEGPYEEMEPESPFELVDDARSSKVPTVGDWEVGDAGPSNTIAQKATHVVNPRKGHPQSTRMAYGAPNIIRGSPAIPQFGDWNKNPQPAEGYTAVFEKCMERNAAYYPDWSKKTPPPIYFKQHSQTYKEQESVTKAAAERKPPHLDNTRTARPISSDLQMKRKVGLKKTWRAGDSRQDQGEFSLYPAPSPSQVQRPESAAAVELKLAHIDNTNTSMTIPSPVIMRRDEDPPKEGNNFKRADDSHQHDRELDLNSGKSSYIDSMKGTFGIPQHRSSACPAPNWGQSSIENTGYKAMDKLKERVRDVVFYKKNIRVLETKAQVLMEKVAAVRGLLITGADDTKCEAQHWLEEADEILKDANGILGARNNIADKNRMCNTCWDTTSLWETGKILRDIDIILERRKCLELSSHVSGLSYYKELQSRESKLEEILEVLTDIHINMIGIYGMVGVGKTVLANELARRVQNSQLFDSVVMIEVSKCFDVKLIQTQVANKIGFRLSEVDDEETRAQELNNALEENIMERGQLNDSEPIQKRKILVILDGIHCVFELLKVGIRVGVEAKASCKVVLITRNADICKEMGVEKEFLVECLNLDEAKILFQERLGDKVDSVESTVERYEYMENVLLMKCGGLPVVINSLAYVLSSMSWSRWESIADQMERCTLMEVDEVKGVSDAILELCNSFIQNRKKEKVFLLCCLIQKGTEFTLERLKRYGMALGLFEDDSSASDIHQMNSWVSELKSLSLLLEGNEPHHLKMPDIVRDVVISALSQGDYTVPVLLDDGTCWHTRESYENCIAISLMPDSNFKCLNGLKLHKLEAYLLKGKPSLKLPYDYFQGMENLKILEISGNVELISSSIQNLRNLVTLHLEHCVIDRVISAICTLERLEVLSLRGCSFQILPAGIRNLTNLKVLDLTHCKDLKTSCVEVVAELNQLRELYLCDSYRDWSTSDMIKLKSLPLEVLEMMMIHKTSAMYPNAVSFLKLRRFIISINKYYVIPWNASSSFSRVLFIKGFGDIQLDVSCFRDLFPWTEFLLIDEVSGLYNGISDLDNIHKFLQLKSLYVNKCDGMTYILDAFNLSMTQRVVFPELQILTLVKLSTLESICCWQPRNDFFPKLMELRLSDLSKLHPHVLPVELAVKLRVMEVSNCTSLLFIFPASEIKESDGTDATELPCMEKLELKGLKNLLALQNLSEASITRDELERLHNLLFSEKIKLPSLKELCLSNLDLIEILWEIGRTRGTEPYGRTPSHHLGNLRYITVSGCVNLKSLFPSSVANSLLQLEKLEVHFCRNMKEIIKGDIEFVDDSSPTPMIIFPKLQTLEVRYLSSLQCFYQGRLLLKFPVLRKLELSGLQEMKAFTLPNIESLHQEEILFTGEIDFPSLEDLRVCGLHFELIKGHGDTTIFPNLSRLTLGNLPYLKSLPRINLKNLGFMDLSQIKCFKVLFSFQSAYMPSMPIVMSQELEELKLSQMDCLEELIEDENMADNHNQIDVKPLLCLRKLELRNLCQLKRIPWSMLTNIRSLIIYGLDDRSSLISTSLLVGGNTLPLLESIEVGGCDNLEAIVSQELQVDRDSVKYGMTIFPCLRHISLSYLPKLQSFSMGRYETFLPSLETVKIWGCHSLQSFSLGTIVTPRIKSVRWTHDYIYPNSYDDLNVSFTKLGETVRQEQAQMEAEELERWNFANEEALQAAKQALKVSSAVLEDANAVTVTVVNGARDEVSQASKVLREIEEEVFRGVKKQLHVAKEMFQAVKEASKLTQQVLRAAEETLRSTKEASMAARAEVLRLAELLHAAEAINASLAAKVIGLKQNRRWLQSKWERKKKLVLD